MVNLPQTISTSDQDDTLASKLLVLEGPKSLILDKICQEFQECFYNTPGITVADFFRRHELHKLSIQRSILNQLEVQNYLLRSPGLLDEIQFDPWPEVGEVVRGYEILESLGKGATSRVYLSLQHALGNRAVVLKISRGLPPVEAKLLGKLIHPSIMPVHSVEFDELSRTTFLCMPFRGKSTLLDLIDTLYLDSEIQADNPLRFASQKFFTERDLNFLGMEDFPAVKNRSLATQLLDIAIELASALEYANANNVIHGDIKPSNVLLTPEGRPQLFDFNLGRNTQSVEGLFGGTLEYMAPELLDSLVKQDKRSSVLPDELSDIYSFGVLLHELFSGSPPFRIDDPGENSLDSARKLLAMQRSGTPHIQTRIPGVSASVMALIQECLALPRSNRPQSMEIVRKRLQDEMVWKSAIKRYSKTHPRKTIATAGAMLTIFALGTWHFATRPSLLERLYSQASAQQSSGDYKGALASLSDVAYITPNDPRLYEARNQLYIEQQNYQAAKEECYQLFLLGKNPRHAVLLGYVLNKLEEHGPAIAWYEKALELGIDDGALYNNLSASYLRDPNGKADAERFRLAETYASKAVRLHPNSIPARANYLIAAAQVLQVSSELDAGKLQDSIDWVRERNPNNKVLWEAAIASQTRLYAHSLATQEQVLDTYRIAAKKGYGKQIQDSLRALDLQQKTQLSRLVEAELKDQPTNPIHSKDPIEFFLRPTSE